jgi:hypothetical protein
MRGKYLNDPTIFLHFCDYPPFEKNLDLHLNKLEFTSCKKCLYQVWLKLAMFHFKRLFPIYKCKNSPLLVSPTLTLGDNSLYNLKSALSESFHVDMSYSGSVVLKEKNWWPRRIFCFLWLSPLCRRTGLLLVQFRIPFTQGWFLPSLLKLACWFWRRFFSNKNTSEYDFPYCGPSRPPGTIIWRYLTLYQKTFMHIWPVLTQCLTWEDFWMTPPHFCYYLRFEEEMALNLKKLESPLPKDDLYGQVWLKLECWFWRRRFFSIFKHM